MYGVQDATTELNLASNFVINCYLVGQHFANLNDFRNLANVLLWVNFVQGCNLVLLCFSNFLRLCTIQKTNKYFHIDQYDIDSTLDFYSLNMRLR